MFLSSFIFFDAGEVVDGLAEGGSLGVLEAGDAASWSGVGGGSEDINLFFGVSHETFTSF